MCVWGGGGRTQGRDWILSKSSLLETLKLCPGGVEKLTVVGSCAGELDAVEPVLLWQL